MGVHVTLGLDLLPHVSTQVVSVDIVRARERSGRVELASSEHNRSHLFQREVGRRGWVGEYLLGPRFITLETLEAKLEYEKPQAKEREEGGGGCSRMKRSD